MKSMDLNLLCVLEPLTDEPVGTIYKTHNLEQFKILVGNREIKNSSVLKIKQAMLEGNYIPPILVNKNNEIIDGQHRWLAAKSAGLFIEFIKKDALTIKQVPALQNVGSWKPKDHLRSHCQQNNPNYIEFRNMLNSSELSFNGLYVVLTKCEVNSQSSAYTDFKEGFFKMKEEYRIKFNKFNQKLSDIFGKDILIKERRKERSKLNKTRVLGALTELIDHQNYNHHHFLYRLNNSMQGSIYSVGTTNDAKTMIENIYNQGLNKRTKIRPIRLNRE